MVKLVSNGKGLSSYDTPDHGYRVLKHTGRSWSGQHGAYAWTRWVAISLIEKDDKGFPVRVTEGSSLKTLRTRLGAYLNDKAAGVVRHPSVYGVL